MIATGFGSNNSNVGNYDICVSRVGVELMTVADGSYI